MVHSDPLEKLQRDIDKAKPQKSSEEQRASSDAMNRAMRMGVEFVSGIAVGSIIGYFLDRWLGTMPWLFVICFFLGTAAGFKTMLRTAQTMTDEERKDDEG
jgi:ATP synthase protein I